VSNRARQQTDRSKNPKEFQMKRAIALAGGGPAAGLHIGVLDRLNEARIKFDVWA
jgi:predicted acylesterase/phospholipase RssA